MDAVREIARAVLYEGYILWPYRRSAMKNQRRWTFGAVFPRDHSVNGHEDDAWTSRTECLLEAGGAARVRVRTRFLHVVERRPARATKEGLRPSDELVVDGERHLAWEEAREREVTTPLLPLSRLHRPHRVPVAVPRGEDQEWLSEGGQPVGAILRSWRSVEGALAVSAEDVGDGVWKVAATVSNTTPWNGGTREEALRQAMVSTHLVLEAEDGAWLSLTDPPDGWSGAAEACRNEGVWPVLVGEEGERHTLLASPIILPDYPRVAPESPGDLFDGAEIDQLLILSILSLTEEEQEEMRATDPRARQILDRCASLSREERMRLHGAIRERRTLG